MVRVEEGELLHSFAREREGVWGDCEGERERWEKAPRGWRVGLTGGVGGEMWRPNSARVTRIGDALADRPRVMRGLSAGRVMWQ